MNNNDLIFEDTHKWHSGHNAIYFSATNANGLYTFAIGQNDINAHFKSINTKFTALFNFRKNERWAHRIATEALETTSPNTDGVILLTPEVINARIISLINASPHADKGREQSLVINHEASIKAANSSDLSAQAD